MSREFPELDQASIVVDEAVKERHLAVIASEVRAARAPRFKRHRLLAVATALLLLLPVIALAADDAVPGDALYPVKKVFEPVVGLFDRDVEAEHRVEEVEILFEREAEADVIWQQIDRARDVVMDTDSDHEERLRRVVDELEEPDVGDDTVRQTERSESRDRIDQRDTDETSDSTTIGDEETGQFEETSTTRASDHTTRPGDRRDS